MQIAKRQFCALVILAMLIWLAVIVVEVISSGWWPGKWDVLHIIIAVWLAYLAGKEIME